MRHFLSSLLLSCLPLAAGAITPAETEFFEKSVRPVLAEQCFKCHGAEKQKGELRVDSRAALLKGGEDGPAAIPGKPEESSLIKSVRHQGDSKMPAKADKLPSDQIAALEAWVRMGMPWPNDEKASTPGASADASKTHWSWQRLRSPQVPSLADVAKGAKVGSQFDPAASDFSQWKQSPIDLLVLQKLAAGGVAPSPRADARTLCRRATFDLTGLPPSTAEMDAFLKASAKDSRAAYEALVDRLLTSPRYGERWGRYWLDVARYADTKGYVFTEERRYPFSYTYRDWVIGALNADLPYDQFIIQQIAGDQVATASDSSPMAALGFLTLGRRFLNHLPDIIDDRIDVVSRGLLGLTTACARCHDHKFDPISQKDYYALYGIFASSTEPATKDLPLLPASRNPQEEALFQQQLAEREGKVTALLAAKTELAAWRVLLSAGVPGFVPTELGEKLLDKGGRNDFIKLRNKVEELQAGPLAPPRAMAMLDAPNPITPHVFIRGNPGRPGESVPRRFLTVLSGGDPKPFTKGSGRLELAQAIASRENPLTARVMVNRVWALHFGRGLVRTPGDFGTKGEPPTHPELLDWLATRFMADGWSMKKLHRLIMLSATYQQASDDRPEAAQADPENRLVWHMNRRRLDFEAMRDSILSCAGQLDEARGGVAVELTTAPYARRRAIYGFIDRQNLPGLFRTFDFASPDATSPQRHVTTVPQQALFMMNSPFVVEEARALVSQPKFQEANAYEEQVQELYKRVYARPAEPAEVDAALNFVMRAITHPAQAEGEAPLWQYGWGHWDAAEARVEFHKLPHFQAESKTWQPGPKLPDAELGFVSLNAAGGHPGRDSAHDAIRRWTAPRDAVVEIAGNLERPAESGDGIIGRVISSSAGELLKVEVGQKGSTPIAVKKLAVKKGETIDFLVGCLGNDVSDGFKWHIVVGDERNSWEAKAQFSGPPPAPAPALKPWEQYAQVLLETNEFAFVD